MNQCPLCGCFVSPNENECPACFKSLEPRELTWDEFIDRLIKAGWTKAEAEKEAQELQEETESGQ